MENKKFINPTSGEIVVAQTKEDTKRMKACGWKQVKATKIYFAKGLENGQSFLK